MGAGCWVGRGSAVGSAVVKGVDRVAAVGMSGP